MIKYEYYLIKYVSMVLFMLIFKKKTIFSISLIIIRTSILYYYRSADGMKPSEQLLVGRLSRKNRSGLCFRF